MSDKQITVLDLLDLDLKGQDALNIRCLAGQSGLSRKITVSDINRPGLALSGF
jgi:HPr kinase/phosphorylase